jgi:hypothetical protein
MAAKKTKTTYWFFNTDESESEGEGAHQRMIDESCIAAWGMKEKGTCNEGKGDMHNFAEQKMMNVPFSFPEQKMMNVPFSFLCPLFIPSFFFILIEGQ